VESPLPFFKNYYSGGIGSVRGYRTASLGSRDLDGSFLGAIGKSTDRAELLFPVPGSTDRSMRFGLFIDAGQVYGFTKARFFATARRGGLSFAWNSPMADEISVAKTAQRQAGDNLQNIPVHAGHLVSDGPV